MFGWIFRRARRLSVREHLRLHELLQTKGCASSVVRNASSTEHRGRAVETFAALLSQHLTGLWHRDVLGLPFGGIVTGGSGVARLNRGARPLGSLRHGRLATEHRVVYLPA